MKIRKIVKLSCLTLVLMIALNSVMILRNVAAQARPKIYVDPPENIFYTNATSVGATFSVSVKSADWVEPGVYSYEFRLSYDKTMLEATAGAIPTGHWLTPTLSPGNIFPVDSGTINTADGYVSFAVTLLGAEPGKIGGGTIATVTLKIIAAPSAEGSLSSSIAVTNLILADPTATQIPATNYDVIPATFVYSAPPLAKPWLAVTPSHKAWTDSAADAAGRVFNISVTINDLVADLHLVGIQFALRFNATLLHADPSRVFEGDFLKTFGETYFTAFVEESTVEGLEDTIVGNLVLPEPAYPPPGGWPQGSGTVAIIEFTAIYRPPPAIDRSPLTLESVLLADAEAKSIPPSRLENGDYSITLELPYLSVDPKETTLDPKGGSASFDLTIAINNLAAGSQMVGAEIKVFYNTTVLQTTEDQIVEGVDNIMREVATRSGTDLFFQVYLEEDYGLIGIILLPLPNGTWPFFPEGTGTLAVVTFTALLQLDNADLVTTVHVGDVLLVDNLAKTITIDEESTAEQGVCTVTITKAFVEVLVPRHPLYPYSIDLYTQYETPYGGQGYNVYSDAFSPQAEVLLNAKVTYFDDAVVGKPVVFTVEGPNGVKYSEVIMTGPDGVATYKFIMPWDASFGLWTTTASWFVGSTTVTDILRFRVGYLATVKQIEIPDNDGFASDSRVPAGNYPVYYKYPFGASNGRYDVLTTISEITMQSPVKCMDTLIPGSSGWITVTIRDELGQPVAYSAQEAPELTITNLPYTQYPYGSADFRAQFEAINQWVLTGKTKERTVNNMQLTIGPNAFSGKASVQGNILTKKFAGVPYSQPTTEYIWIKSKATPPTPTTRVSSAQMVVQSLPGTGVAIDINNVDPSEHITGIQIRVEYDPDIVDVKSVSEGDFVKKFGDTFFQSFVEPTDDHKMVLIAELQLPDYPGAKGWMTGSGTVCKIWFYAVSYIAPPPTSASITFNPSASFLVDADANKLVCTLVDGSVILSG